MAKKISPPRGMNDVLPVDAQHREAMIRLLTPIYSKWGFSSIETPAMENIERLIGSDGGDNEKLVFQVLRRGLSEEDYAAAVSEPGKLADMGLRYDLTVPMARFYASNHSRLPRVSKFLQYGPVWRAERPQKGRFRQFMQWDADIVGASEGLPEIELILCTAEALSALGLNEFVIRLNDRRILRALVQSVGIEEPRYDEAFIVIDKLDKVGIDGIQKEMAERGFDDSSISALAEKLRPFLENKATSLTDGLAQLKIDISPDALESVTAVFDEVKKNTKEGQVVFDPTLVRGMGYYTGQIFEVEYPGYSFSIAGGGRYDGMIGRFLGKDVPACGFSLGFDRILTILNDKEAWPSASRREKLLLLTQKQDLSDAIAYANTLRDGEWDVCTELKAKNMKHQIEEYRLVGFSHFCVFDSRDEPEIKPIS